MTPDELPTRSTYLFLSCAQAAEQFAGTLAATYPTPPLSTKALLDRVLRREMGLLVRYWVTRRIWEQLEDDEANAKALNLSLLRQFTSTFGLPKDGSGLRYAELSSLTDELGELAHRITTALGMSYRPLLDLLQQSIASWQETILQRTNEAVELPLDQLAPRVRTWLERSSEWRAARERDQDVR